MFQVESENLLYNYINLLAAFIQAGKLDWLGGCIE